MVATTELMILRYQLLTSFSDKTNRESNLPEIFTFGGVWCDRPNPRDPDDRTRPWIQGRTANGVGTEQRRNLSFL
jgi:hypothetical protein